MRRLRRTAIALVPVVLTLLPQPQTKSAQDPGQYAIQRCQSAIRDKLYRDEGGNKPEIDFDRYPNVSQASNTEAAVSGVGRFRRDRNDRWRPFRYDSMYNFRSGRVTRTDYNFTDDQGGGGYPQDQLAIERCQSAIRERLLREQSGSSRVDFDPNPNVKQVSNVEIGVSGSGRVFRGYNDRGRRFGYEAVFNFRSGRVNQSNYNFDGGEGGGNLPGDRWYEGIVVNRGSNKCLDVYKGSTSDEANVQQFECRNTENQIWRFVSLPGDQYAIVNRKSGKVLDVVRSSTENNANIQQFGWHGGDNQRWRIEPARGGFYQIVNVNSGKCIDVQNPSTNDEVGIVQNDCTRANNQLWRLSNR